MFFAEFPAICHAQSTARAALTPEMLARLTSQFRSATDQKPLRETLQSIASSSQVNVWLDRQVDPTQPVSLGAQTNTPYEAFQKAAAESALTVCAVDGIVLVGRPEWVHSLVGVILSTPTSRTFDLISWPEPSTPQAALETVLTPTDYSLPHDLWPATSWKQLEQQVAVRLICAQCELMPGARSEPLQPLRAPERVVAAYPSSQQKIVQQTLLKHDPQAKFQTDKSEFRAFAQPLAHVAAINAWITEVTQAKPRNVKPLDIDRTKFTLKIENAPAEQVLLQLAARCNRQITFDDMALVRCAKLITLEVTDQSLRSICDTLAAKANVTIQWTDQKMTVTAPP